MFWNRTTPRPVKSYQLVRFPHMTKMTHHSNSRHTTHYDKLSHHSHTSPHRTLQTRSRSLITVVPSLYLFSLTSPNMTRSSSTVSFLLLSVLLSVVLLLLCAHPTSAKSTNPLDHLSEEFKQAHPEVVERLLIRQLELSVEEDKIQAEKEVNMKHIESEFELGKSHQEFTHKERMGEQELRAQDMKNSHETWSKVVDAGVFVAKVAGAAVVATVIAPAAPLALPAGAAAGALYSIAQAAVKGHDL